MKFDNTTVKIREIETAHDTAWEGWNRIYYDSFPENERMSDGYFQSVLQRKANSAETNTHLLVMMPSEEPERVIGMAYYEVDTENQAGFLWYLATQSEQRGQGYGAILYANILQRLRENGARILLYEVEMPALASQESAQQGALAERRIGWYRRQGAAVLEGVQYFQTVDAPGMEPVEMHIMAQPFAPMDAEQVFASASQSFWRRDQTRRHAENDLNQTAKSRCKYLQRLCCR